LALISRVLYGSSEGFIKFVIGGAQCRDGVILLLFGCGKLCEIAGGLLLLLLNWTMRT
jgi:hypothetical protein